jgi:N-acetyltransferase
MQKTEILTGKYVRLEPLEYDHTEGLVNASAADTSLYSWSPVPQGIQEAKEYIRTALELRASGSALAFATIRMEDDVVLGSTRFFNIENWLWAEGNVRHDRIYPDACEIGYTWLTKSAIRTAANTEAKFLMLQMAFEKWKSFRVCLHTDIRNAKSRAAIERIGGKFEGILRAHRLAVDQIPRDSARFSILLSEWPDVKQNLQKLLDR